MSDNSYDDLGFMTIKNWISEAQNVSNSEIANVAKSDPTQLGKLWIGDSACSCSTNNDNSGTYDLEVIDKKVIGSGGQSVHTTVKGKQKIFVRQKDGRITKRVLQ